MSGTEWRKVFLQRMSQSCSREALGGVNETVRSAGLSNSEMNGRTRASIESIGNENSLSTYMKGSVGSIGQQSSNFANEALWGILLHFLQ